MVTENTRDVVILLGVPLVAAALVAVRALDMPTAKSAWRSGMYGTWGLSIVIGAVVGAVLDFRYSGTVEIPTTVLLPLFEVGVGACIGFVAAGIFATAVRMRQKARAKKI